MTDAKSLTKKTPKDPFVLTKTLILLIGEMGKMKNFKDWIMMTLALFKFAVSLPILVVNSILGHLTQMKIFMIVYDLVNACLASASLIVFGAAWIISLPVVIIKMLFNIKK